MPRIPPGVPFAPGLVVIVAGLSVSAGAGAVGSLPAIEPETPSETTEPSPPRSETTDVSETSEPVETTEVPETTPFASAVRPEPIEWTSLGDGLEEGRLEVPIDYANPGTARSASTSSVTSAADPDRRASAHCSSTPAVPGPAGHPRRVGRVIYSPELLDGSTSSVGIPAAPGESEPPSTASTTTTSTTPARHHPDEAVERQQLIDVAEDFADQCVGDSDEILPFVGTNNMARDMDTIRRALGEDEISYFGFSYGSELGAHVGDAVPRHRARRRARRFR